MNPETFFIFAGEVSGDLHGGELLHALRQQHRQRAFFGVGGPKMRDEGLECILRMEDFQVMGLSDVLLSLPKLYKQFYIVLEAILKKGPTAVILIDYPGFNLRLAKALRDKKYSGKIIQYISPSVWAHGKKRIEQMAATLDLLLTIYPFETDYFTHTSLPVRYVGNPLIDILRQHPYEKGWKSEVGISGDKELIALFSGSRQGEVKQNLPKILEACQLFKSKHPEDIFGLSVANDELLPLIQETIQNSSLVLNRDIFLVPKKFRYELMRDCRTAIAKSGTVTLELALHHKPTVVVYQLTLLNKFYAKYVLKLKLPHYCIVNILLGKRAFPEMIEEGYEAVSLEQQLSLLDEEGELRQRCVKNCERVSVLLNNGQTSQQAASAIHALFPG